ncbi:thiamine diphosphokinase [Sphingobacterium bambusae]|uniref:Thiamine diphosphokinase n=1 Tax=Sphingobacterium bambusae TaxID=662858 RepID=A0ABW6BIQ8_9SPHI|nr:thiamine diphosphokinase [Sphingobacterium bambusae]WPL51077.1 thiamine diphosphokinase [Sphingobacterium bambusae]
MSSHHIVRENQEPALIILSADALDSENLGQLLEWSPTILTDDYHIDFLLAQGIKVDVVLTKQDTQYDQEQIKRVALKQQALDEALEYLIEQQYKAVNVACDSLSANFSHYASAINIVVFVAGKRIVFVRQSFEKWKAKGERIYVDETQLKSLVGLRKVTENVFETEQEGFFYLGFNTDEFVAVGERL